MKVNYERVQLYADWLGCGLNLEILRQVPGRVRAVNPEGKNCFLISTVEDNLCLWLYQGREESLNEQLALMEYCSQQRFTGFVTLVPLRNGRIYGKMDEHNWFYLTKWACFEKIAYRNLEHLRSVIHLMVNFRESVVGCCLLGGLRVKEHHNLLQKMQEVRRYLAAFEMLARYRINATKFDRLYLDRMSHLEASIARSVVLLENSKYQELAAALKPDDLVINDFSRGNLRVTQDGRIQLLRLKNLRWDLPVMDLAVLLLKSGRSQRWKRCWYEALLDEYQKEASVSSDELAIIKAYLCFPWNMWHLISRYYLNRVAWPNYVFNDKLERLIGDEKNRLRLMAEI